VNKELFSHKHKDPAMFTVPSPQKSPAGRSNELIAGSPGT
jgi:hypothetical protein